MIKLAPIKAWSYRVTADRKGSRFSSNWTSTLKMLRTECRALGCSFVTISVACRPRDVIDSGMKLKQDAVLDHPGVILSYTNRHGTYHYPCDTYLDWKDNVHAVVLAIKALRAVDRYGVSHGGQQFAGWKELPAPPDPWEVISEITGISIESLKSQDYAAMKRNQYRKYHPDTPTGDKQKMARLTEAFSIIESRGLHAHT